MTGAVVIGGGPAGAAAAIRLARAGVSVTLLEREAGPHDKVCGEFLSAEALDDLRELGVEPRALGAVPVERVRLHHRRRSVEAALPFPALSLSRRMLDEALLARAAAAGAMVLRGVRATGLERGGAGWRVHTDAAPVEARHALLATGKHDLRGLKRPPGLQGDLIGFKLHWRLVERERRALDRAVELYPFDGGYAGLEPVEDGRANLCLLVRRRRFAALGGRWPALLAAMIEAQPVLGGRLEGAAPLRDKPLAVAGVPYGFVARTSGGVWRLGDQAAVIPSFSGDGQSIALHSARLACEHLLADGSPERYQRRLHRQLLGQVLRATALSQALVRPWAQALIAAAATPGLIRLAAGATRIPQAALGHDGAAVTP